MYYAWQRGRNAPLQRRCREMNWSYKEQGQVEATWFDAMRRYGGGVLSGRPAKLVLLLLLRPHPVCKHDRRNPTRRRPLALHRLRQIRLVADYRANGHEEARAIVSMRSLHCIKKQERTRT